MKTIVLMLAIVVGFGVALQATVAISQSDAEMPALTSQCDDLREKISRAEQRLRAVQEACAMISAAAGTDLATIPGSLPRGLSAEAVIANNPKIMAEALRNFRESSDYNVGRMFRTLGFSPEQIEKWKDLLVQVEQRRMDLVVAAESQGLDQRSAGFKNLSAENEKFRLTRETEILGDLEPAYREYQRTEPVRYPAARLAVAALYSGESVAAAQVEQVTQILAANSQTIQTGSRSGWVKENSVDWTVAKNQLMGVLSPSQIETLQAFSEQDAREEQLNEQVNQRTNVLTARFTNQSPSR